MKVQLHSFLNSAQDKGKWSASSPRPLYARGTIPSYPQFNRRLGGSAGWSGRFEETKNLLPQQEIERRFRGTSGSFVLMPNTLFQLSLLAVINDKNTSE
jgi:hypothetical protein